MWIYCGMPPNAPPGTGLDNCGMPGKGPPGLSDPIIGLPRRTWGGVISWGPTERPSIWGGVPACIIICLPKWPGCMVMAPAFIEFASPWYICDCMKAAWLGGTPGIWWLAETPWGWGMPWKPCPNICPWKGAGGCGCTWTMACCLGGDGGGLELELPPICEAAIRAWSVKKFNRSRSTWSHSFPIAASNSLRNFNFSSSFFNWCNNRGIQTAETFCSVKSEICRNARLFMGGYSYEENRLKRKRKRQENGVEMYLFQTLCKHTINSRSVLLRRRCFLNYLLINDSCY